VRHRADSGQETDSLYFAMISIGRMRIMMKQKKTALASYAHMVVLAPSISGKSLFVFAMYRWQSQQAYLSPPIAPLPLG
jgi:hypothetical protein